MGSIAISALPDRARQAWLAIASGLESVGSQYRGGMRQTYVSLGPESVGFNLILIGLAVLLPLGMWIWRRIPRSPVVLFGCLIYGAAGLLSLPQSLANVPFWFLVTAFLAASQIDSRNPSMPRTKRGVIEITAALLIGVPIGAICAVGSIRSAQNRLTLTDDHLDFTPVGRWNDLPRKDFHVREAGPFAVAPFDFGGTPRPWHMWLSGSGYYGIKAPGPVVLGLTDYWGPDGLVNGDVVGRRLAEWSGNPILPNSHPPAVAQRN